MKEFEITIITAPHTNANGVSFSCVNVKADRIVSDSNGTVFIRDVSKGETVIEEIVAKAPNNGCIVKIL